MSAVGSPVHLLIHCLFVFLPVELYGHTVACAIEIVRNSHRSDEEEEEEDNHWRSEVDNNRVSQDEVCHLSPTCTCTCTCTCIFPKQSS